MVKRILKKLKPILLVLGPVFAIGVLVGIYPGYEAYRYMWKDAKFCMTCHKHDYASQAWKESVHGKITTCHDCHHQSLRQYSKLLMALATKDIIYPANMKHLPHVTKDLCESCHSSDPKSRSSISGPLEGKDLDYLPKIEKTRLHSLHLKQKTQIALPMAFDLLKENQKGFGFFGRPAKKIEGKAEKRSIICVDCHGGIPNRAHNFSATDASCTHCHEEISHDPTLVQKKFGCRNCHFAEFLIEE